jgi:hypothetical protein
MRCSMCPSVQRGRRGIGRRRGPVEAAAASRRVVDFEMILGVSRRV